MTAHSEHQVSAIITITITIIISINSNIRGIYIDAAPLTEKMKANRAATSCRRSCPTRGHALLSLFDVLTSLTRRPVVRLSNCLVVWLSGSADYAELLCTPQNLDRGSGIEDRGSRGRSFRLAKACLQHMVPADSLAARLQL
ncbi:hypothetical protein M5D96_006782 [Drosophila gunungcola]|uniref:Uncharacterized protein n=1 Tax=Drosophila gunungcola TaxID=103775 RepID=A0A9P9YPM9_9MUSC|nr:hypothetical protein M5D96_006782 [Drosophila gunungcola]